MTAPGALVDAETAREEPIGVDLILRWLFRLADVGEKGPNFHRAVVSRRD